MSKYVVVLHNVNNGGVMLMTEGDGETAAVFDDEDVAEEVSASMAIVKCGQADYAVVPVPGT